MQWHSQGAVQPIFFTQQTRPNNHTGDLHHIGYRKFENTIKEGGFVPEGFNHNKGRQGFFTLVNPTTPNPDPRCKVYKHLELDHDAVCVVDKWSVRKRNMFNSSRLPTVISHVSTQSPPECLRMIIQNETRCRCLQTTVTRCRRRIAVTLDFSSKPRDLITSVERQFRRRRETQCNCGSCGCAKRNVKGTKWCRCGAKQTNLKVDQEGKCASNTWRQRCEAQGFDPARNQTTRLARSRQRLQYWSELYRKARKQWKKAAHTRSNKQSPSKTMTN